MALVVNLEQAEKVLFKCGEAVSALNFMYLAEAEGDLESPVGEDFTDARITLGGFLRVLHHQERGKSQEKRVGKKK